MCGGDSRVEIFGAVFAEERNIILDRAREERDVFIQIGDNVAQLYIGNLVNVYIVDVNIPRKITEPFFKCLKDRAFSASVETDDQIFLRALEFK